MTDGQRELIRYRMARAREALDEANLLLANAHVHTAVNRIYHALRAPPDPPLGRLSIVPLSMSWFQMGVSPP